MGSDVGTRIAEASSLFSECLAAFCVPASCGQKAQPLGPLVPLLTRVQSALPWTWLHPPECSCTWGRRCSGDICHVPCTYGGKRDEAPWAKRPRVGPWLTRRSAVPRGFTRETHMQRCSQVFQDRDGRVQTTCMSPPIAGLCDPRAHPRSGPVLTLPTPTATTPIPTLLPSQLQDRWVSKPMS